MKQGLRLFRVLACLAVLLLPAGRTLAADERPLAVWFYADWCPNCKVLAPKYEAARSGYEARIRFVTLDLTDEASKAKARDTAKALGITPLYFANHATGWVALLDGRRQQVGALRSDESVDDLRAALERLAPAP